MSNLVTINQLDVKAITPIPQPTCHHALTINEIVMMILDYDPIHFPLKDFLNARLVSHSFKSVVDTLIGQYRLGLGLEGILTTTFESNEQFFDMYISIKKVQKILGCKSLNTINPIIVKEYLRKKRGDTLCLCLSLMPPTNKFIAPITQSDLDDLLTALEKPLDKYIESQSPKLAAEFKQWFASNYPKSANELNDQEYLSLVKMLLLSSKKLVQRDAEGFLNKKREAFRAQNQSLIQKIQSNTSFVNDFENASEKIDEQQFYVTLFSDLLGDVLKDIINACEYGKKIHMQYNLLGSVFRADEQLSDERINSLFMWMITYDLVSTIEHHQLYAAWKARDFSRLEHLLLIRFGN